MDSAAYPGLTSSDAQARLAADGPNALPTAKPRSTLAIALGVLREPMFLLLCAASGVYLVLGDLREALILLGSIVVVLGITIVQERRTERALDALRDLSSPRALVIRDGVQHRISGVEVVAGDLVLLQEGDRVPADARLLVANDFSVDESMLTGESVPVVKQVTQTAENASLVYSGTLVVKGQAQALVSATGPRTELGRIGRMLVAQQPEKTALQRETAHIVKTFGAVALALCIVLTLLFVAMRGDWLAGVLAGLTLAMSIVPEEFPVVLTVFLALGAWRISRLGVLTRQMSAVETLGAATVLCVDKTGTLTENRMALAAACIDGMWRDAPWAADAHGSILIEAAALACELDPFDPMERAILNASEWAAPAAAAVRDGWRIERDYPFTSEFLAVCHAWRAPDGTGRVAVKGAPETVLRLCNIDVGSHDAVLKQVSDAASRGLRVLAVAETPWGAAPYPDDPTTLACRWLGLIALADPLRETVPAAVAECRRAGIRIVMITGDYPATAVAIARQAGLATESGVLTGRELEQLDEHAFIRAAREVNVFARIVPEQKLKLVAAYKALGEVVAMTGDGVNDAPALKAAHIGVAMGQRGSDVAREAAALVLTRDDFGAIVETVRLGRRVYENIRNAMRYLISVHVPIAGMSLLPVAFGWPLFLFPVHVVFFEFVIDPACSVAFEAEETEEDAMGRPPRDPQVRLFDASMFLTALGLGGSVLLAIAAAYWWMLHSGASDNQARAVAFAGMVFGNLALLLSNRSSKRSIVETLSQPNPALWWIVAGTLSALGLVLYLPWLQDVFRFAPLASADIILALVAGTIGVVVFEVQKYLRRR